MVAGGGHGVSTPCRYFVSFQSQNSWQGLQVRPPVAFATVAVYRAHMIKAPEGLLSCVRDTGLEPVTPTMSM